MTYLPQTPLEIHGTPVLPAGDGPPVDGEEAALLLAGEALGIGAELVVIPLRRLPPAFFDTTSGLADRITQTFLDYRLRVAYEGDLSHVLPWNAPFAAAVRRGNAGPYVWFTADRAELAERLRFGGTLPG
ncbi:DUF4180 domain-containing protein [Streptomyces avicenniae]|uniref:DUF4180 domain-containing protein n=1 Tax=Streptomyces avicenniae TaxID=500153 RepID=UPI00069B2A31|nr:DUF4180 domain-containing protein [Streptomyces avicenniae]